MATIINKKINGYGPYSYLVTYTGDGGQDWEYLGPLRDQDPREHQALLAESDDGLETIDESVARTVADPSEHDLKRRPIANALRDELAERFDDDVLAAADDRRTSDVMLAGDAPETAVAVAEGRAEEMTAELDGASQADLTDRERDDIDFTETNVPRARAAKAAILDEGVDDWLAVWSEDITTTSEAREAARRNRESIQGDRLDNETGSRTAASHSEVASQREEGALKYAQEGDEEARAFLTEEMGWTDEEIDNYEVA